MRPPGVSTWDSSVCGFDTQTRAEQVREKISLTGQFAAVDGILTGRENLVLVASFEQWPTLARWPTTCWHSSG